jgi:large subunit ribosomal protein L10
VKREIKAARIDELKTLFAAHGTLYAFDYNKMTVAQATDLRRILRQQGAALKVVKNRLALRSLGENLPADLRKAFRQPTAIASTAGDPIALARTLRDFQAANKVLVSKGGVVEGTYFAPARFDEITRLASRTELLGKVGFLMAAPLQRFLRALGGPLANLGILLKEFKVNNSKGEDGHV